MICFQDLGFGKRGNTCGSWALRPVGPAGQDPAGWAAFRVGETHRGVL